VADVPEGPVTVMSTDPVPGGEIAVIDVSEFTVKDVAGVEPNFTPVAPVNPAPRRFTVVPPIRGPEFGATPVMLMRYVKVSALVVSDVPASVVTVTST
jgi:hypothetical protein